MARRTSTLEPDTDESAEDTQPETTEAVEGAVEAEVATPAEDENTPDAPTEGESADGKPAEADAEADLGPFEAALSLAIGQADESTGDLPDGALEPVLEQYRALPSVKDRNRAKSSIKELMKKAMFDSKLSVAKAYLVASESLTTAAAKKDPADRKPADPTAQWRHNLSVATLAYGELFSNPPEGVDAQAVANEAAALGEKMAEYRTWLDTEVAEGEEKPAAPEVPAEVIAAFRMVRGSRRVGVGRGNGDRTPHEGPRRNLGKHIEEAFASVEVGTFLSVADIRKFKSSEYGDEEPSAGAISARLFPSTGSCTIEGIEPGTGGEKGTKGAYKRA